MRFADLDFKPHPASLGGIHATISFPNGYGASIIQTPFSHGGREGRYELAVLKHGLICYDTEITSDVEGWQTAANIEALLARIEALPG